jgi:serine/threonine-protein kinase
MANDAAATRPRSSKPLVVTAIAASLAAAAITALVLNHHRSSVRTVTAIPPAVAPAPTDTPQQTSAATTPTAASSTAAPARDDKAPASNLPSARELALFRDLENTALDARRRAVEAGASAAALDSGDAHNRAASRLIADGKAFEAGEQLRLAAASWTASERAARLAVASNTTAPPSSSRVADPAKAQSVPPVSAATSSAPVTQQSTPTSITPAMQQPPPAPPANPSADIGAAVVAYARALESRDVAAVRRAYPGITSSQARSWEQFFSTLRSLRVALTVSDLAVNGSSADAKILGTYDYVTDAGKTVKQPVSFQATFRRDNSVWQLASVH